MRHAATVVLLLLASCSTLSTEEQDQLADYQRYAKEWYQEGRLPNALNVIDKGLALDPDNYQLNTLHGAIQLQLSGPSAGFDHQLLDEATDALERMYYKRALHRHSPALLLNYAMALQKQARRQLFEADRRSERAIGSAPHSPQPEEIAALRAEGEACFARSEELFGELLRRGEMPRLCHKHLLLAAYDRGDDEALAEHEQKYFEFVREAQKFHKDQVQATNVIGWEEDQKRQLAAMRAEELEIRALLAGYYSLRKENEQALAMLTRVLELDPRRSNDYYNRGRIYLELGRLDEAKSDFDRFIKTSNLPSTSDKIRFAAQVLLR